MNIEEAIWKRFSSNEITFTEVLIHLTNLNYYLRNKNEKTEENKKT